GFVSDHWLPISPVTGRLDAFEWKDPLAGEEHAGAVIDAERHVMLEPPAASSAAAASAAIAASALASAAAAAAAASPHVDVADAAPRTARPPASGEKETTAEKEPASASAQVSETGTAPAPPVIPLVHAPDDPGPSANAEVPPDPAPEGPDAPPPDGWTRFRAMFKS